MPFSYEIDTARRLVVIILTGDVSGRDIHDAISTYVEDPAWRPGYDRVWDSSGTKSMVLDLDEVRRIWKLLEALQSRMGEGRTAVVARRDVDRTAAEIIRAKTPWPLRIFPTMEKALAWIDEAPPAQGTGRP